MPWGDADLTPVARREWRGRPQRAHFLVGDGSFKAHWKTDLVFTLFTYKFSPCSESQEYQAVFLYHKFQISNFIKK